jgi:glycerol-3-phosphate dehydrogenase
MPERLCLENLIDAAARGASIRNYCEVVGANKNGSQITSLLLRDTDTGETSELHARVFVNATGAWFDRLQSTVSGAPSRRLRTTKGIHLTCAPLVQNANVLFSPLDGRLFFVIPLLGKTWIGTTDTDYPDDPTGVRAGDDDIEYLLRSVEPFFPTIRQLPIYSTNAGVRALVRQPGSESSVSRVHKVEETAPGLFSVLGGKITGYRAIAEEAAGAVCARLGITGPCRTAAELLPGGGPAPDTSFGRLYGSRAGEVEALVPTHGTVGAQAVHAARHEFCRHLDDFLLRRTESAFDADMGASVAPAALDALAGELQWSPPRRAEEWERFRLAAGRAHAAIPTEI